MAEFENDRETNGENPVPQEAPVAEYEADPVFANDGLFGRLADLVVKPSRLMDRVGASPRWLTAVLLVFVLISAFSWLAMPISAPEQLEMMRDSRLMQMMPEDQWQQQYDEALDPSPTKRILNSLGGGLSTMVMVVVFGFALGFFARMGGGQGSFKQALGVVAWASVIPFGVATLVKAPLVLATESVFRVSLGLAALLPDGDPGSALYQILMTYGDFFSWWGVVVLIIGFERVFRMSRGAAVTAVVLPWILLSAIPVGIALLFM